MIAEPSISPAAHRLTYDELASREGERREELYDGELVEMTAPRLIHQEVLRRLLRILEAQIEAGNDGKIYIAPHDVYVSPTRFFQPDLSFVRRARFAAERIEREDGACLIAPPDLIVEIVSPSTARRDRVDKVNAYAAFGVRHYWIVAPEERTLHAFALLEGETPRYLLEAALGDDDTFAPSLFPNLKIDLAALFAAS